MMRSVLLGMFVALTSTLLAQSPSPLFDVASVKTNASGGGEGRIEVLPTAGRLRATNVTLRSLILRAYGLHQSQLIGLPDWASGQRFDVDARTVMPSPNGPEALLPPLQGLLGERFGVRAHFESKELPAYMLVLARRDGRLGQQIRPTQADCAAGRAVTQDELRANVREGWPPCGLAFFVNFTTTSATGDQMRMRIRRSAVSMAELAKTFQATVDGPVVDRTGLEGRFDVEYTFSPQPPGAAAPANDAPHLLVAIEEQLGIKLQSERTDVPVLVIDHVERPTEN